MHSFDLNAAGGCGSDPARRLASSLLTATAAVIHLWAADAALAQAVDPVEPAQPDATDAPDAPDAPDATGAAAGVSRFEIEAGVLYHLSASQRHAVELPGVPRAVHVVGGRAFVALGESGAAVVSTDAQGAARVEKLIPVSHGAVTGFLVEGDTVWMQVSATSAIRLHGGEGGAPITPTGALPATVQVVAPPRSAAAPTVGSAITEPSATGAAHPDLEIVEIFGGRVLLSQGKRAGLRAGDRFKVVRSEQDSDEGGTYEGEREVAVVVVDSLAADSARARIWRGDRVVAGDRIEPADRHTDPSLVYPRQLFDFVELEAHARPILNVGDTGFGVLVDGSITYVGESIFFGLRTHPFGIGRTQSSTAFTQTTLAEAGYNSRPFAIGLGVGLTSVFGDLQEMFEFTSFSDSAGLAGDVWEEGEPEYTEWKQDMQHAFALGQRVRLGAMDGLNLVVANTLLYFSGSEGRVESDNAKAGFIWGGTNAKLTIPLALNADLFFEGGGGVMGYGYGAVGVFGWLQGNGGPGSLGLFASAGGAGVWGTRTRENLRHGYTEQDDIIVSGPMVSLGLRYRYGLGDAP